MTEAQARAAGPQGEDRRVPVRRQQPRDHSGQHEGFVKVVADEKYGEILGVHIIGPEASS